MLLNFCLYCRKFYELLGTLAIVLYTLVALTYAFVLLPVSLVMFSYQHETLSDIGILLLGFG
jgi:hypothetical protein